MENQTVETEVTEVNEVKDEVADKVKNRRKAVSYEVFDTFMESGETANLTIQECADKLSMTKRSFEQRLNDYRKQLRELIKKVKENNGKLTVNGTTVDIDVSKLKMPVFKSAHRGRQAGVGKKEYTASQERALRAFLSEQS